MHQTPLNLSYILGTDEDDTPLDQQEGYPVVEYRFLFGDVQAATLFTGRAINYYRDRSRHKWDEDRFWVDTQADRVMRLGDGDEFGYNSTYDPNGTLGQQAVNVEASPTNPYATGIDAQSKETDPSDGGTATDARKSQRDSTINTDGTTHQDVVAGLHSQIQGSGGIPTSINVNYDEKAKEEIKRQQWALAKLRQQIAELEAAETVEAQDSVDDSDDDIESPAPASAIVISPQPPPQDDDNPSSLGEQN